MGIKDLMEHDAAAGPSDGELGRVQKMAADMIAMDDTIAALEKQLDEQRKIRDRIAMDELPAAMAEIGVAEFKLIDGSAVSIKSGVKANIPKKHERDAFKWLRDNGAASLIKAEVKAKFGKGDELAAIALARELSDKGINNEQKTAVAWNTLTAFVKERMENGLDVPTELLGVYEYKRAEITRPKTK